MEKRRVQHRDSRLNLHAVSSSISERKIFTNCWVNLFIYQLLRRFIQIQIHAELTKVERQQTIVSNHTYQTIPNMRTPTILNHFRFFFFLASTTKVVTSVETGTSVLQANDKWHKMIWHDMAIWRSQDMAFTNMKNTIYLIIQVLFTINDLQKQST